MCVYIYISAIFHVEIWNRHRPTHSSLIGTEEATQRSLSNAATRLSQGARCNSASHGNRVGWTHCRGELIPYFVAFMLKTVILKYYQVINSDDEGDFLYQGGQVVPKREGFLLQVIHIYYVLQKIHETVARQPY